MRPVYNQLPYCCIAGCTYRVLANKYSMCSTHWGQYGGKTTKDRPAWVNFLINDSYNERYRNNRDKRKEVSLEHMCDLNILDYERVEIYRGPERKRRSRTKPEAGETTLMHV